MPVTIAHLTESVSRKGGGLFDAVLRLAQAGDRGRFEQRAFGRFDEFSAADLVKWPPVQAQAFAPQGWRKFVGGSPEFGAALAEFAPDLCHTHGMWLYPSIAAKTYAARKQRPYLISPHGMLDPWALQNSRWKKRLAWWLFEGAHLRGARCLRALCTSEADSIHKLGLGNPLAVIPNGIDLPEITRADGAGKTDQPPPWLKYVQPGQKVLLYLGRIHPKKGLVNLFKAWGKFRTSNAEAHHAGWILAVAGWDQGGHEDELKLLCRELQMPFADLRVPASSAQLSAPILFLGPQFNEAKLACYAHCDAFVLPSFSEGLPMVVLEAWANAKPVLMTPECNLPEGFQAGAALSIVATEAGVAAGLNEFCRMSGADHDAMGRRGRALVEARFTWSRVSAQMEEVYLWMLGGGARPGHVSGAC